MDIGCQRHPGASATAASSKKEAAPMAGKLDNPAMNPHTPEKTGTHHTDKWWKVERERGKGKNRLTLQTKCTFFLQQR